MHLYSAHIYFDSRANFGTCRGGEMGVQGVKAGRPQSVNSETLRSAFNSHKKSLDDIILKRTKIGVEVARRGYALWLIKLRLHKENLV